MNLRISAFVALLLSMTLTACSTSYMELPDPRAKNFPVQGIDVSRYQGDIDWHKVRSSGIEFAWLKATEGGDHADNKFIQNWNNAKAAGVMRGAYHFYYFCRPVSEQISWVFRNVPVDRDALPLVLDMEWVGESKTCRIKPPRDKVVRDMHTFLEAMERHYGKRPVIYSSVDFHREMLEGKFDTYDFWLRSVAAYPRHVYGHRDDWIFWQYTAEGRVPGIKGNVDRNVFYGSENQWRLWLASQTVTTPQVAAPAPTAVPVTEPVTPQAVPKSVPYAPAQSTTNSSGTTSYRFGGKVLRYTPTP